MRHALWKNILVYVLDKISWASQFSKLLENLGVMNSYVQNTSQLSGYIIVLVELEHNLVY